MTNSYIGEDGIEDLHRRIAFGEACSNSLDFDKMLTRVCSLLNEWAQADVVTLILPPEDESLEPMLHVFGQQPVLPLSEQCIRDDCAGLLSELEYAHLSGESLRIRRGADLRPLNGIIRDDFMYRFWWHDMKIEGETVAIIALYGFVDWVLSARIKRLLSSVIPALATAVNNAASVENFRIANDKDEVTGGLNQRGVFEQLDRECARSADKQSDISCILFQLEGFDAISGTFQGEKVLQAFHEKMLRHLRPYHMTGRIADAEFVAILPEVSSTDAQIIARKISDSAQQITLGEHPLSVRLGCATVCGGTADDLLHQADAHLFENQKNSSAYGNHAG